MSLYRCSFSRCSDLTLLHFLTASIFTVVNAGPLPQLSVPTTSEPDNINGQYTPEVYPGQKGYYEVNSLSPESNQPPSEIDDIIKYVINQNGGSFATASNSIQNNAQPLTPNTNTVPISGVPDTSSSDYDSNGLTIQHPQQPEIPKKSYNLASTAQTSNKEVNPVKNDGGAKHTSQTYQQYIGDGSINAGWPDKTKWVSFEDMYVALDFEMSNEAALSFSLGSISTVIQCLALARIGAYLITPTPKLRR